MAPKHATRDALLTFIRTDSEPRHMVRITRYMRMMHGVKPGATREALHRLVKAGKIERLEDGRYQIAPAGAAEKQTPAD